MASFDWYWVESARKEPGQSVLSLLTVNVLAMRTAEKENNAIAMLLTFDPCIGVLSCNLVKRCRITTRNSVNFRLQTQKKPMSSSEAGRDLAVL
jgi:hypothetical protein